MRPATNSPALIPTTTRPLPRAVAAKGARIFDESGLDYIDASSGPLAVSLGHGHPKLGEALRDQFASVDYVHRTQFRNEAAERLADLVTRGARLGKQLRELQREFPFVGDVRGLGYMWGLEFVADPATAAPPDPALNVTGQAIAAAAENRLIVYPAGNCADGAAGDAFIVAPPLTSTDEELDEILAPLRATLVSLRALFPR
jgi:adenosylmethionine-8-amino-7-oxononanoate aminotransferase